jgi:BirA family biotin operon repressor/biotin-[acetyl-CoA-carboxylase] ligase
MELQHHHFERLESTNTLALEWARQGAAHGTLISAAQQDGGRGRAGRSFFSPLGGLYFSLILRPRLEGEDFPLLTLAAGLGLCQGLHARVQVQPWLKWPNDLYWAEKKLGGILTESGPLRAGSPDFVVLGVGINVAPLPEQLPAALLGKISTLAEAGRELCPAALLPGLAEDLLAATEELRLDKAALLRAWRQRDYLLGRAVEYLAADKVITAVGAGLAEDGRYGIIDPQGNKEFITAGDINPLTLQ